MTSIFENTKSKVTVHIFHDNTLTEDNRKKFIRTAEKYSQAVEFHDVTGYASRIAENIPTLKRFTVGCLFRLLAPCVLKLDKVIYLDADIVVNLDIKELWDIDLGACCIGGRRIPTAVIPLSERLQCMLNNGECSLNLINAGVMIMNLDMIRKKGDIVDDVVKWFSRRGHLAPYLDQDFINAYFIHSIKYIDDRFNIFSSSVNPTPSVNFDNCILHMIAMKPWETTGLPFHRLYWNYYLKSAWGEDLTPSEVVDKFCTVCETSRAKLSPFLHMTAHPCLKITLIKVPKKIFWSNQIMRSLRIIVKDMYYRLKYRLMRR